MTIIERNDIQLTTDKILPIREILKIPRLTMVNDFKSNVMVKFEDDVMMPMSANELVIQRYILDVVVLYDVLPIVSGYAINNYYVNGYYVSKSINSCFELIFKNVVELVVTPANDRSLLEPMFKLMYETFNNIYNEVGYNKLEYVGSVNVFDFIEIQTKPAIVESILKVKEEPTYANIDLAYKTLDTVIRTDKSLSNNPIVKGYISSTYNPQQTKQMLSCIGFRSGLDGVIYKKPLTSSYVLGMNDMYEMLVESSGGQKSLVNSSKAIGDSEYFARKMQLVTMAIEKLVDGDCGNKDYVDIYIKPADNEYTGDLIRYEGKYYLDKTTNTEVAIKKSDKHLEGTTIPVRVAYNCKLTDSKNICTKCFGAMSNNIPLHAGLGHYTVTVPSSEVSQKIISTKHLISSAAASALYLDEVSRKFLIKSTNGTYKLADISSKNKHIEVIIDKEEMRGLTSLNSNTNFDKLEPLNISNITNFDIIIESPAGRECNKVVVSDSSKNSGYLTRDFIKYAFTDNNMHLYNNTKFVIDMDRWFTKKKGFIAVPDREYDFVQLSKMLEKLFSTKVPKKNSSELHPEVLAQQAFNLLNRKLVVNAATIEVIVAAFTVYDLDNNNYNLARNSKNPKRSTIPNIIRNRSLGSLLAYENHVTTLASISNFNTENLADTALDVVIMPEQVLRAKYGDVPTYSNYRSFLPKKGYKQ